MLALLGTGFWYGREYEQANALRREAALRAAEERRAAESAAAESQRLAAERARVTFDTSMEDAAYAEPVSVPVALPASRMRRLQQR